MPEVIFNIRAKDVILGDVHWTETNLAMWSKPGDVVSVDNEKCEPEPVIN